MDNTATPKITLGVLLKDARCTQGLTLREVEQLTGISNAYLSQLENDKIKSPSTHVLYKLATIYGMTVEALLEASGLIVIKTPPIKEVVQTLGPMVITDEELGRLLQYLRFLRWQNNQ